MKRYFVKTNAYSMVAFADENNRAYAFAEDVFDEPLTLETAQAADYSATDNCETAEEVMNSVGTGETFDFTEYENDGASEIIEF